MSIKYCCSFCGKENVKLWRPDLFEKPLICAKCAEKHQVRFRYNKIDPVETIRDDGGTTTTYHQVGTNLPFPLWKIDSNGKIPVYNGPNLEKFSTETTDILLINIPKSATNSLIAGKINFVPAVPSDRGFWDYKFIPDDDYIAWQNLPTN